MKVLASTQIIALAFGAGLVAPACRAHAATGAPADRDGGGRRPPEPAPPPVVDSDGDGVPDPKDASPSEPEDHGSPDASSARRGDRPQCRIKAGPIAFSDNSAVVRPSTAAILDSIVVCVHDRPDFFQKLMLQGHADRRERNPRALANARVAAIQRYLVNRGVPRRTILVSWYVDNPVYPYLGDEPDGASDGRRVDFQVWAAR